MDYGVFIVNRDRRKKDTQPSQAYFGGYIFCCYMPQWCFFVLGNINQTRLD